MLRNLFILLLTVCSTTVAAAIEVGAPLPPLEVQDKGELVLHGDEVRFEPWSSEQLDTSSAVQIVQYMAARPSSEKQVRPFTDALEAAAFPEELHDVVTVVNLDDVTFGMSGWALSELEKNKEKHPETTLVGDSEGKGLEQWNLEPRNSALFVLDENGKVMFFKEGELNEQEIDQVLELIGQEVAKRQKS